MEDVKSSVLHQRIQIDRLPQTDFDFNKSSGKLIRSDEKASIKTGFRKLKYKAKCSRNILLNTILKVFPILSWIPKYEKRWIPGDLISGLTVGVVHIPQSLAFSILAGLPPVFGLYTSFYPVLIYTIMGTSRHISIGTFAVTSLMTSGVLDRLAPRIADIPVSNESVSTTMSMQTFEVTTPLSPTNSIGVPNVTLRDIERVQIAGALTLLMGIFQILFGIFRLGFITSYLSTPLIQAFTTGAAVHVVTSQTPSILGLKIRSFSGPGSFFLNWIEIFKNIGSSHPATVIISVICMVVLAAGREINLRYKAKLKMPIPTEVVVVVIAILASHFGRFEEVFNVVIVKNVPTGLPAPVVPGFDIMGSIIGDAFAIAIVAFAINVSLAKLFAMQNNYEIDPNQELVAYGTANLIPSFFLCFPSAAALARCAIQTNTGGNTQVVGVISVVVILIVVLVLGPLFQPLPRSVLGSIIIVGLFGILAQILGLKDLFRKSKVDFTIWLVTFLFVIILGVDMGLLAGVVYSILTVIARTQLPRCEVLVNVTGTDIYRPKGSCSKSMEIPGITVFKFYSSLYYANKEIFKDKLRKAVKTAKDNEIIQNQALDEKSNGNFRMAVVLGENKKAPVSLRHVIVDCSTMSFVDLSGAKAVVEMCKELAKDNIRLLLATCNDDMADMLMKENFPDIAGENCMFITTHDAVVFTMCKAKNEDFSEQL